MNIIYPSIKPTKKPSGFSLLELMLVISIISILATIAMPSYKSYLVKAKVIKALSLLSRYKLNIAEYYSIQGKFPDKPELVFNGKNSINMHNLDGDIVSLHYEYKNDQVLLSAKLKSAPKLGKEYIYIWGKAEQEFVAWGCGAQRMRGVKEVKSKSIANSIPAEYYPRSCG